MAKSILDRIRAARQVEVKSGAFTFTVRRPTDLEYFEMRADGRMKQSEILRSFVLDWGKPTEIDLGIPGGTGQIVPWEPALWSEWIADNPEHWQPLTTAVIEAYVAHDKLLEERSKNCKPGS